MRVLKVKLRRTRANSDRRSSAPRRVAAGTRLTFRAELMPGQEAFKRTFTVARVLAGGRVELRGLGGQHTMTEFEPAR